jgi:nitric oxide reductase subunit C
MRKLGLLLFVLVLALAACGGGGDGEQEEPASGGGAGGDAANGEELFKQTTLESQAGCITCHSLEPDQVIVGPSMAGVADRAGDRVSGLSAEEYLRQSILETNAYVVEGFPEGVMPAAFSDALSDQQVDDLVAFMLTLD